MGTERRAKRDGCECPEFVMQCAHFEGQILVLSRLTWPGASGICTSAERYAAWVGETYEDSQCGNANHWCLPPSDGKWAPWVSLPEAQAEFSRREALLLGREPVAILGGNQ
ncbi:hypothetical protein LCGC14_1448070 [marine sediment metagenome]|uniref:Uncharacterized protein n=1 Tax=marine sediment metagenome TaxID=412755 RepID=A0A0F9K4X1_9ZZZZ